MQSFNQTLNTIGDFLQDFLLLALRLIWGLFFLQAGLGKLENIYQIGDSFQSMGILAPQMMAFIVAAVEAVGGFCLIFGIFTRLVTIPLIIVMVVALWLGHGVNFASIYNDPQSVLKEGPFTYLLVCIILFAFGPGRISIDHLFGKYLGTKAK